MIEKIKEFGVYKVIIIIIAVISLLNVFIFSGLNIEVNEELVVDYTIIEEHDENFDRYSYVVLINEEASIEELKETTKKIANQAADDKTPEGYAGLSISFHDRIEYTSGWGYANTLGTARFIPERGWGAADSIEPGEYDKLEFDFEELREKNWEEQPTQKEAEIYSQWDYVFWELYDHHQDDEQKIYEMTADRLEGEISPEEVKQGVQKVEKWIEMGKD